MSQVMANCGHQVATTPGIIDDADRIRPYLPPNPLPMISRVPGIAPRANRFQFGEFGTPETYDYYRLLGRRLAAPRYLPEPGDPPVHCLPFDESSKVAASSTIDFYGAKATVESIDHCAKMGSVGNLINAIGLAKKSFSPGARVGVSLDFDPEDSDEYVVVRIHSPGEPSAEFDSYIQCLEEWSDLAGWPGSRDIRFDLVSSVI